MRRLALVATVLLMAGGASGAPVRLDDSASPRSRVDAKPRWLHVEEGLASAERINAMIADVPNLEVRLNTSRFVGKRARVYLVFPVFVPGVREHGGIRAQWRTRGVLLAGTAIPGDRVLVYDGSIASAVLSDSLDLSLYLDARFLDGGARFEPVFELELAQ
jgi:hypothetical protein